MWYEKMKKTRVLLTIAAVLMLSLTTVSAAWSGLFTRMVPRWGAWSDPSASVEKTDTTRYALFYLNTAPHTFPLYGDLLENGVRSTVDYYKLSLGSNVYMYYKSGYGAKGSYQQGRVSSSNYEPDARNVTFKFNP